MNGLSIFHRYTYRRQLVTAFFFLILLWLLCFVSAPLCLFCIHCHAINISKLSVSAIYDTSFNEMVLCLFDALEYLNQFNF